MKQNVQIKINGQSVDIDDSTAIGITFAGFSTDNLGKITLSHTNTFSLPLTRRNEGIIAFYGNMNMNTKQVQDKWYDTYDFELYVDGMFVFGGKTYVDGYQQGRVNMYVIGNRDLLDVLKNYSMWDATEAIVEALNSELDERFSSGATWDNIVGYLETGENLGWIPYSVGTLNKKYPYDKIDDTTHTHSCGNRYDDTDNDDNKERYNLNNENVMTLEFITNNEIVGDYKTGCIYVRLYDLFVTVLGNLGWNVSFDNNVYQTLSKQYIRMEDIVTHMGLTTYKFAFMANDTYHYIINNKKEAASKKVPFVDLLKYVCQEYCLMFDVRGDGVEFHSLRNIRNSSPIRFRTKQIKERSLFLEGVPQKSYIAYSDLADETVLTGGKQIISNNKNIEKGSNNTVLMEIKRYLPGYFVYLYDNGQVQTNTYAINASDPAINGKFVVVQRVSSETPYRVNVRRYFLGEKYSTYAYLYRAGNRTVEDMGYWDEFASLAEYPDRVTVDCFMSPYEATIFEPWRKVEFDTLPGQWVVESVSQYNPRLESNEVEVTAIRIRD